ncbi:hypothetical protein V5O48_007985 [Marasmius crinis-equi]|uniref:DH domain-containing protein n=1 Tax=Marasmius crinis-equi TaxID=585013 RepID=A0ABR3FF48_9AGAR
MALNSSPRKLVPLPSSEDIKHRSDPSYSASTTKRVFFCGVVVEGSENGRRLPEEIQELVLSLGDVLEGSESENGMLSSKSDGLSTTDRPKTRERALTDTSALSSAINELVATERSYVQRLRILKKDYADPLRNFARSKSTAILPKYEATTLFGNVDNLLPVNEAFLTDLEKMVAPNGARTVGGVGDVALRHFKDLRGFEQYRQYYVKREEAQLIFEREVAKRSSFAAYIDRIKYQSSDTKNRVGLRELLMDPVQRIPRYTLLFRLMIKHMATDDPQRTKLIEADEIASKIAQAETDEQTRRASIFYCLIASIDGFPPDLFSNSRKFIDCIDVEEAANDAPLSSAASSSSSSLSSLHCTLFLFDDKVLLVKRPGEKSGRTLAGLDDLDKVAKAGVIPSGKKKSGMVCKGVFDVTDVVVTDVGGADIHLYLENPPQDLGDRWSGRSFRALSVVHPPAPPNLDPPRTSADKSRFLENLWKIQANYRARAGQSVVLRADEVEVESKGGKVTLARTYYNVYQRTAFLQEPKKTKIVVHIDANGSADKIPFGLGSPPFVVIRLQPLAGGVCRYKVTSSDPSDPGEEDIVQTTRVPSRVVLTIHQFGLFQFKTGKNSRPATPTARTKVSIFGLDAISRTLFASSRPGSSMGDFFSGSINSHRRTKSTASRSSMYTQTTGTADSSFKFSHRSNSTAATTVSGGDDDASFLSTQSSTKRKQRERALSETEGSFVRSPSKSLGRSRSASVDGGSEWSDVHDDDDDDMFEDVPELDASDQDLALQLELARRNSKNQNDRQVPTYSQPPQEIPIYEEDPPPPVRPASRASTAQDSSSQCTITGATLHSPPRTSRSLSRDTASERRPLGPRSPSPLPPSRSPRPLSPLELTSMDGDEDDVFRVIEEELPKTPVAASRPTGIPRSKRQNFHHVEHVDSTPRGSTHSGAAVPIEPLSIKKKTSVRSGTGVGESPLPRRTGRTSLSRSPAKWSSPRRVSPQIKLAKIAGMSSVPTTQVLGEVENILHLAQTTKEDVESGHRAVKRLKLEIERQGSIPRDVEEPISRPSSPLKGLRTQQRTPGTPMTRAAQDRLEEMRMLIGQRNGELTPRKVAVASVFGTPLRSHSSMDSPAIVSTPSSSTSNANVGGLASEADANLVKALTTLETLQSSAKEVSHQLKERTTDLEKKNVELQNARRQLEVMKSLLDETTKEKEIMYEAFNEELDGMYNDANLPDDEAWVALTDDLRDTKASRNHLSKENSELRRRLAELELQLEECRQENCRISS